MATAKDLNKEFLNHTKTHVMISNHARNLIVNYASALTLIDLNQPIKNRKIKIGYVEYTLPDTHPLFSEFPIEKLQDILLFSDAPDVFDKKIVDVYTRRFWHSNIRREGLSPGYLQAISSWMRELDKVAKDKTNEEVIFAIAYMSHYVQDALCPMHVSIRDQDIHFKYEKWVSDNIQEIIEAPTHKPLFYQMSLNIYPRWDMYVEYYTDVVYNFRDELIEHFRKGDYEKAKIITRRILHFNIASTLLFVLAMLDRYNKYIVEV